MRTYWIVETRGGPGNADITTQSEHRDQTDARTTAKSVGGKVWYVVQHDDGARYMRQVDE